MLAVSTTRRAFIAIGAFGAAHPHAFAQDPIRIGLIAEMSGPFAEFGRQMQTGIQIYQKQFGDLIGGRKVEIVVKDVGGPNPELAKRLAQELIVREKVHMLAGFGFTPNALSVAPLATQAKVPMVVMNAAAAGLTAKSPFMVRTSFNYADTVPPIAQWAARKGAKKAYVLVADYAPGHDAENAFITAFKSGGGDVVGNVRTPLVTLDFSPYLQRVKDAKPDVLFAFVNAGDVAPAFIREYREKGLDQSGIQLIGTGDVVDESIMDSIGDRAIGLTTVYPYSMHHKSDLNRRFVDDFKGIRGAKARPTIMAVSAYDGMAAIYAAVGKAASPSDGAGLLQAMQGLAIESPRGRILIDPPSRDVVQDQYIRRVEKVGDVLANVEFETFAARR